MKEMKREEVRGNRGKYTVESRWFESEKRQRLPPQQEIVPLNNIVKESTSS